MSREEWWVMGPRTTPFGVQEGQLLGPFDTKSRAIEEAKKVSSDTLRPARVLRTMATVTTAKNTAVEDV